MLIQVQRQDQDGVIALAAVNAKFITSAVFVKRVGLTALNMHNQPTIWVTDTASEVMARTNAGAKDD